MSIDSNKDGKRKALGRGLSALIPGAAPVSVLPTATIRRDYFECAIEDVHPSPDNPRKTFSKDSIAELAASIRAQGLVQPLIVRARAAGEGGGFWLIAGERRWRAAQLAGLKAVSVVVKDFSAADAFERALVENLQREDLNPIEEAEAFQRLIAEHNYTQEQVAERVGKDRTSVTNTLRLLKLPASVRGRVASGELPMGHARALLGIEGHARLDQIEKTAAEVVARGLSVRQTEALVRRTRENKKPEKKSGDSSTPSVRDLVQRLERALGTRVRITQRSTQAGCVEIDYASLDQLDGLLDKLLRP